MTDRVRAGMLEQIRFLHELGVDALRLPATADAIPAPATAIPATDNAASLAAVRRDLGDCTRCALSAGRSTIVFGVGNPAADLMFIGEGPGEEEDRRGEPFVGRAGQLLDRMIASIGLKREQVYIANIVKCRPPQNRNPHEEEIAACLGFLAAQVEAIQPRVLVALGKVAASALLQENIAITRARGQMREFRGTPLMLTYHPAYLLRQYTRENRQAVYDDLLQVKTLVDQAGAVEIGAAVAVRRHVEVAVPLPVRRRFTYLWPESAPEPQPGQRVVVPFGRRRLTGVVMKAVQSAEDPNLKLREVERVLEPEPSLPAVVLDLVRFAAGYYVVAEGEMLRAALPAGLAAAGRGPAAIPTNQIVALLGTREIWEERQASLGRAPAQAAALRLLGESAGRLPRDDLRRAGVTSGTLRALLQRGWIEILREPQQPHAPASLPELTGKAVEKLTADQESVTARLLAAVAAREESTFLLHGVTGSGKTEVYLRAAAAALDAGRQVLILVPEIGLTPALSSRLARRFGDLLAVLHSGLSGTQRRAHWDRARRGEARVVVGARSAVFAPLADVGLIVVDEEHDGSYKQDESPRYNGRDLALVRGRREHCPVVLASATPSMESFQRAAQGKDQHLVMPRRVHARPMPPFEIVDLRREFQEVGRASLLSRPLEAALTDLRRQGGQAMLLLNRRGWAAFLLCRACGDPVACPSCSVSLTLHRDRQRLACHYCGHEERVSQRCPGCAEEALQEMGAGTERLEDELASRVPGLRAMRLDADAVRRAGGHAPILSRFAAGEADVLLGTQMIAKGHDIPGVTLVGILGGDAALSFPDFRAAEWTFQLVSQAAGRAGRGHEPGRVILQAFRADHYALRRAREHDYDGFFADEDRFRRALLYPPHAALAAVRVRHGRFDAGEELARRLGDHLRADPDAGDHLRILGPAPAPLARLRGFYRFHLLLKSRRRRRLTAVLGRLADQVEKKGRQGGQVIIDVDPVSLM